MTRRRMKKTMVLLSEDGSEDEIPYTRIEDCPPEGLVAPVGESLAWLLRSGFLDELGGNARLWAEMLLEELKRN